MASSQYPVGPDFGEFCKFCLVGEGKYVCPRCFTPYCSLSCYRSEIHLDCSEAFHREWVEGELKASNAPFDGKHKVMEILSRMYKEDKNFDGDELDSDDDNSLPDLSERLANVNINDSNAVWDKLSESEQAAFKELVSTGRIAKLIPHWKPWWIERIKKPMVTDFFEEPKPQPELEAIRKKCPPLCDDIRPLSEITKIKPEFSVSFDLINILGSYSVVVRYYNGNHFDFPEEAATLIHQFSKSLVSPQKFPSVKVALEAVATESMNYEGLAVTQKNMRLLVSDAKKLMEGPSSSDSKYYMFSALSDMQRLFSKKGNESKETRGKFISMFPDADLAVKFLKKDDYKKCLNRLKYFTAWVAEYGNF